MKNRYFKKELILVLITLFVCTNVLPNISGDNELLNDRMVGERIKYSTESPRMVYGILYINNMLAPNGVTVKLTFSNQTITNNTFTNGNYVLNFNEDDYKEGTFSVLYFGVWYTPNDNLTVVIEPEVVIYEIDLHIVTPSLDIIYVDDDFNESTPGWNFTHFNKIQNGIYAVNEDGTLFVYNGIYYENIIVNKTINLTGEDRLKTIINGSGAYITLNITSDSVNISSFTIDNIWANGNIGICLNSDDNIIWRNNLLGNGDDGITVFGNYNTIAENIFENNGDGIWLGTDYIDNMVYGNNIRNSTDDGIYGGNNNYILGNIIHNNYDCGIYLNACSNNTIVLNNISDNGGYGINITTPSQNNFIYHNNLINNTQNSYDDGNNIWDDGYPSGGNYWSDFDEPSEGAWDNNSDGIVDSSYYIPGTVNVDKYPFLYPNFWLIDPPTANFTFLPSNPEILDIIQFNDTSSAGATIVNWWWDFDDGYYSTVQNPIHLYIVPGIYNVSLTLTDSYRRNDTIQKRIIISPSNEPPNPPYISGSTNGTVGIEYEYTFNAVDQDGDNVFYYIDWGDNTSTEWVGSYPSGENATVTHKYVQQSLYIIRAKAKDVYGEESDWGTFKVVIPKDQQIYLYHLFQRIIELFPNAFSILSYLFRLT